MRARLALLGAVSAAGASLLAPAPAGAQLLKLLSPGDLTEAHAGIDDCGKCHQTVKQVADRLCLACHRPLAARIHKGEGTHAGRTAQPCVDCHADHKGRGFNPVAIDRRGFDHGTTGFALDGRHAAVSCEGCHKSDRRFSGLERACGSCHDDGHGGALGARCQACHATGDWAPTRAVEDHRLPMTGAHAGLACKSCHGGGEHLSAANTCATCHSDPHRGRAESCTLCHSPKAWKDVTFDHDTCAMGLTGQHREVECETCHAGWQFGGIPQNCKGCHAKAPRHGDLGECGRCHDTSSFSKHTFKHSRSRFKLTGKHEIVDCRHCHAGGRFDDLKGVGRKDACLDCHKATPKHGDFGNCAPCHDTTAAVAFDHGGDTRPTTMPVRQEPRADRRVTVAGFPLRGAHLAVPCQVCHVPPRERAAGTEDCARCHADLDPHGGQFGDEGTRCASCHAERAWAPSTLSAAAHVPDRFPLEGAHATVPCGDCHDRGRFRGQPTACADCHVDRHAGRLGAACADCHDTGAFSPVEGFEARHGELSFALTGAHEGVACAGCHAGGRQFTPDQGVRCATCHGEGDPHGGAFGARCEGCHRATAAGWGDRLPFDHRVAGWPLVAAHSNLPCADCHRPGGQPHLVPRCAQCHRDPHRGGAQLECGECHAQTGWLRTTFNHAVTGWQLAGRHVAVPCADCHTDNAFVHTPSDCQACHAADRPPGHRYPSWQCSDCHGSAGWSPARFDHAQTGWPLRGAHAAVARACGSCHRTTAPPPARCAGCHGPAPPDHVWTLRECAECHRPTAWGAVSRIGGGFVHPAMGSGGVGLTGSHALTPCGSCHTGPGQVRGIACEDCHRPPPRASHTWWTACGDCHDPLPSWPPRRGWRQHL